VFLDGFALQLGRLADAMAHLHFASGPAPRQLGAP
jgi:hypothetical protein